MARLVRRTGDGDEVARALALLDEYRRRRHDPPGPTGRRRPEELLALDEQRRRRDGPTDNPETEENQ